MTTAAPVPVETVGAFEKHTLPNGVVVYYRDSDHSYWAEIQPKRDGGYSGIKDARLTGVSTVVAPFDWRPDNLMKWAARIDCEGVSILAAEGLSQEDAEDMRACLQFLTTGGSIVDALTDARLHHTQTRDDAAERGTNVHKHALQALADGRPVPSFDRLTVEEAGCARGVMGFWHECEPEPLASEHVVADRDLRVAGRLDLICRIGAGRYAGATALLDAKTSAFLPIKHHVQIAGYRHCADKSGLPGTDLGLILQVRPDGSYELVKAQATPEDFALAVSVYRRNGAIQSACNQARKAAA